MKFSPCTDQCTTEGTHCLGCGRSHIEISETRILMKGLVDFAKKQEYENIEEFSNFIGKTLLKKLKKTLKA